MVNIDCPKPEDHVKRKYCQKAEYQEYLSDAGLPNAEHIDGYEDEAEDERNDVDVQFDDEHGEGSHSHKGEGALQAQGEPDQQSVHGAHGRSHGAGGKKVRPSRPGHRGHQLGLAQHPRYCQKPGQKVGDDNSRTGPGIGEAREDEDPGADHGAACNAKDIQQIELFFQFQRITLSAYKSSSRKQYPFIKI